MFLYNITWHFLEWSCGETFVIDWIIGDSSVCCRNVLTCFKDVTRVHRQKVKPHFFNTFLNVITLHPTVSFLGGGGGVNTAATNISHLLVHMGDRGLRGTHRQMSPRDSGGNLSQQQVWSRGRCFSARSQIYQRAHKDVRPGSRLCRCSAGIWGFSFFQPTYFDPYFKITPGNTGPEVATEVNLKVYALRKARRVVFSERNSIQDFSISKLQYHTISVGYQGLSPIMYETWRSVLDNWWDVSKDLNQTRVGMKSNSRNWASFSVLFILRSLWGPRVHLIGGFMEQISCREEYFLKGRSGSYSAGI